jgi:hypothetical protein
MTPLDEIKVLGLSRILAGPWCTMTLADLGATMWKVEAPGTGDETPTWIRPQKNGISTCYLPADRNKQSIAVDLCRLEGHEIVLDLARQADVVVEELPHPQLGTIRSLASPLSFNDTPPRCTATHPRWVNKPARSLSRFWAGITTKLPLPKRHAL